MQISFEYVAGRVFEYTQKQVDALKENTVKALTGESQLDLANINQMNLKYHAKLEVAQQATENAKVWMETEKVNAIETKTQNDELKLAVLFEQIEHYNEKHEFQAQIHETHVFEDPVHTVYCTADDVLVHLQTRKVVKKKRSGMYKNSRSMGISHGCSH